MPVPQLVPFLESVAEGFLFRAVVAHSHQRNA
jgi:hypothetical protein